MERIKVRRFLAGLVMVCFMMCIGLLQVLAQGSAVTDWENDIVTGTGYGAPPDRAKNPGHARILAHQAAMLDAYRRLAEQANGIHITAESTIEDNISTGDIVAGQVDAVVKRAKVISENYDEYGNCTVVLEVPLYGVTNSLAKVALKPVEKEAFPAPSVNVSVSVETSGTPTAPAPSGNIAATGGYTGLVVDCSGLGLSPVMSPVIRNADSQPIYGYKNLDYDKVIAKGMASYANGMNGNKSRAGSNPLVVKAVRLESHNSYPVISTADADKVLAENQKCHFLDNCAVVFVR
ncbi:LPP20 family lipoprotein [Selenomonas sp. AB3002]|uniref:LPP20 family lipoprotein n=1 Tax=Selenomonas sp. AB3002 TaxID=1392502 RepID=UPI0004966A82